LTVVCTFNDKISCFRVKIFKSIC